MMGGFFISSLFLLQEASADTLLLKNGKEIKGLVVERHADRIILSTEKGEIPILLSGIKDIRYDDPEQNFMQIGRAYEAENKYGEALAYYEKATEINPNFEEAKKAVAAMKSRFWASSTEGPQSEMEKQQALYDSWGEGKPLEGSAKKETAKKLQILREDLGLSLVKRGDWVFAEEVYPKKDAALAGLRAGDRLVEIDIDSLRFLNPEVVAKKMMAPRFSSFVLDYERDFRIDKPAAAGFSRMGLQLELESEGTIVKKTQSQSPAALSGIREGDVVVRVNGQSTRYMPLSKVENIIASGSAGSITFSIRRSAMLTRR